jgi:antitoxin (DNA-binding transcriptional repressor) of toxin-antitoxin stability system
VSEFKARCSELVELVASEGRELVITKHGVPVARLVCEDAHRRSPRGAWKGLVAVAGDIVQSDWADEFEVTRE